jgi:hydroxyacylglutathione hydrolase
VLVVGFPVGAFQANCYLLATGEGQDCVIVDPGQEATAPVEQALRKHRLRPVAVLATHGHFDHVYSAAALADAHDLPVWIHPGDRAQLSDPLAALGPELAAAFDGVALSEPGQVCELGEQTLELAGMRIEVEHTPGHTPGSVVFRVDSPEGGQLALTGDTLFAGAIGRTDLPGGDARLIARSLRSTVLALADETVVLPGHGASTTIGRERATNPFLTGPFLEDVGV